ncbi:MAG: 4-(cytidine 5'-diphospho)-2-C-methyl-D-erythritol kinase [Chlorobia bacterium]|nr:4-(cytidine 5'-diphospho)-2-C-methyl-D-erythritol kinase [Fimbriimonadaceae bacterium]
MVLQVASPAKINLFLAVGPKDEIGYHPIRTIFQAVGLFDSVKIDLAVNQTTVEFTGQEVPEQNTVTKALRLMSEFADMPPMAIQIQKNIPAMAGLGGGSSNAAAVIRAARHLVPGKLTKEDAFAVAEAVGADVPFFLVGGRAKGEGYGEKLTPLPDPTEPEWVLLVKPEFNNSTLEMYAKLDDLTYPFADFPTNDQPYNDFERTACECTDIVERILTFGAKQSGMTGSGSAVFGIFDSQQAAEQAQVRAQSEGLGDTWAVPILTRKESLMIRSED